MNRPVQPGSPTFFAAMVIVFLISMIVIGTVLLYAQFDESSDANRTSTAVVLTNTAIYIDYVETLDALDSMATATQRAFETGDYVGAPTRTPTENDYLNTAIPLTNTAIYIHFDSTESWPPPEYIATNAAIETSVAEVTAIRIVTLTAAATTATPSPDLATHQIPLTQTAVHADYVGTQAALDDMATGTAGALFAATPEASPIPAN